jgi:hypothetical protein
VLGASRITTAGKLPTSHRLPALGYPQPVPAFKGVSAFRLPLYPSFLFATMLTVDSLRARAARLQQLNLGLAEEVAHWKAIESPLLDAERQACRSHIPGGIACLDDAWHALTTALGRMEKDATALRREYGDDAAGPRHAVFSVSARSCRLIGLAPLTVALGR